MKGTLNFEPPTSTAPWLNNFKKTNKAILDEYLGINLTTGPSLMPVSLKKLTGAILGKYSGKYSEIAGPLMATVSLKSWRAWGNIRKWTQGSKYLSAIILSSSFALDTYENEQLYVLFENKFGGVDLEKFKLKTMKEAISILKQVRHLQLLKTTWLLHRFATKLKEI